MISVRGGGADAEQGGQGGVTGDDVYVRVLVLQDARNARNKHLRTIHAQANLCGRVITIH